MDFVIFVIAMGILIWGANIIIIQSEYIALKFKIPEFIIGATFIAFGSSLPEIAVAVSASMNSKPEIALSNVIGSNILNITLILALVFIITKKIDTTKKFLIRKSIWILIPLLIFILIIMDGVISRFDGSLLILLISAYILFVIHNTKYISKEIVDDFTKNKFSWIMTIPMMFGGFILIILGAHFSIESASNIAHLFGVSEWIIGIIMISLGTLLPELVISISASIKGKADIAIGNIIGSNIANLTIVLGTAAITVPIHIDITLYIFDIITMLVSTLLLVVIVSHKLYSKSAGISLLIILGLFINNILETL